MLQSLSSEGHAHLRGDEVGLVIELQRDAVDHTKPVSQLLQKAKVVASKLKLSETTKWIDHEISGYKDEVPEYRSVTGVPKAFNPYNGWIPISSNDAALMRQISRRTVGQSVAALESVLRGKGDGILQMPFSPEFIARMNRGQDIQFAEMSLLIDRSAVVGILDAVRNAVLDWALALEAQGVTGEGFSFTKEEEHRAKDMVIQIGTFTGNLNTGSATGTGSSISLASGDISSGMDLFDKIEELAGQVESDALRIDLLEASSEMRKAHGTSRFLEKYQKFISIAADHIGLFAPVLPALSAMIS